VFAKSSRCLLHFSVIVQDGPYRREVNVDSCTPLVNKACTTVDRTFTATRSMRLSSMNFSTVLNSPDIHARDQISRVGERIMKVAEWMARLQ
jgi:hypothetical protein